jgi:hypothetical protein
MSQPTDTQQVVNDARTAYEDSVYKLQRGLWQIGGEPKERERYKDNTELERRDAAYTSPHVVRSTTPSAGRGRGEWHWLTDLRAMEHLRGPYDRSPYLTSMLPPPLTTHLRSIFADCTTVLGSFCDYMSALDSADQLGAGGSGSGGTNVSEQMLESLGATAFSEGVNAAIAIVRQRKAMDPRMLQDVEGLRWAVVEEAGNQNFDLTDEVHDIEGLNQYVVYTVD